MIGIIIIIKVLTSMRNKTRMYLTEAVRTITLIRDMELEFNINSPNHLTYNSVHTALCASPASTTNNSLVFPTLTFVEKQPFFSSQFPIVAVGVEMIVFVFI